jgi:ATP-dependent Zn protease
MWVHLATRTSYDSRPKQNVAPPEVVVIPELHNVHPKMKTTPQKLIIEQVDNINVEGYLFPNIKAVEYKNLKVTSQNGILFDSQNRLMVKPLDNQPITVEFKTEKIKQALWITILSWIGVIIFFIVSSFQRTKLLDD